MTLRLFGAAVMQPGDNRTRRVSDGDKPVWKAVVEVIAVIDGAPEDELVEAASAFGAETR